MSNQRKSLCIAFGRYGKLSGSATLMAAALLGLLLLPAGNAAWGQKTDVSRGNEAGSDRALRLLALVPIPVATGNTTGGMYSFDISYVDQAKQTYYLGDRSNKAVDVVNARNGHTSQIFATPPFRGTAPCSSPGHGANDCAGPDGVVAAFPWLFVTDANSRVVSFDLRTTPPTQISDVTTSPGDPLRADELAYDPQHGTLLVINNADNPPFGTLISVNNTGHLTVGARITFTDATNGAEQPVWDPDSNRFYLSIPQIGPAPAPNQTNKNGAVKRINPFSATVEATYPVHDCGPAGLALGPNQDLFIGCTTVFDTAGNNWSADGTVPADPRDVIIDARTGNIDATLHGIGAGDEVWYNSGDNNYYATGSSSPERPLSVPFTSANPARGSTPAAVVDAKDRRILQRFATYNVPAGSGTPPSHPSGTSHSIAANAANNFVFVPFPANNAVLSPDGTDCLTGCIAVFGHPDEDGEHRDE
jgi:hypothetical protein